MRFSIRQLICGVAILSLLMANVALLFQIQKQREIERKAVAEGCRVTEAEMFIHLLERTDVPTKQDRLEAVRLASNMAIDTENRGVQDWGDQDYKRAYVACALLKHLEVNTIEEFGEFRSDNPELNFHTYYVANEFYRFAIGMADYEMPNKPSIKNKGQN